MCPSNRFENLRLIEQDATVDEPNNWRVYDITSNTLYKEILAGDDFSSQTCTQERSPNLGRSGQFFVNKILLFHLEVFL